MGGDGKDKYDDGVSARDSWLLLLLLLAGGGGKFMVRDGRAELSSPLTLGEVVAGKEEASRCCLRAACGKAAELCWAGCIKMEDRSRFCCLCKDAVRIDCSVIDAVSEDFWVEAGQLLEVGVFGGETEVGKERKGGPERMVALSSRRKGL